MIINAKAAAKSQIPQRFNKSSKIFSSNIRVSKPYATVGARVFSMFMNATDIRAYTGKSICYPMRKSFWLLP